MAINQLNLEDQYSLVEKSLGASNCDEIGRLLITGSDALDLLNRLSTNNVIDMDHGQAMDTVLTSSKGRIIDLLKVVRLGETLIVFTSIGTTKKIIEWLDFYTFDEDITVEDITGSTSILGLIGPDMPVLFGLDLSKIQPMESCTIQFAGQDLTIIKNQRHDLFSFYILARYPSVRHVWKAIADNGIQIVGDDVLDIIRIEHGIPAYGSELNEDHNPLEAGILHSVNFEKGCYIGQEVVLRLKTYDKVQRRLVGIVLESEQAIPGLEIQVDGRNIGKLTSVSKSIRLGKRLALGYVRTAYAKQGQRLTIVHPEFFSDANIVDLPIA